MSDAQAGITRLESFMRANEIKPAHLARSSGYSRQHLMRLRKGTMEPTRRVMVALAEASSYITHRAVQVWQLFDLGGEPEPEGVVPPLRTCPPAPRQSADSASWRERLREAIDVSDRKHNAIAREAGITPATLSKILAGKSHPRFSTVVTIAHVLGVSVGWLLGERG